MRKNTDKKGKIARFIELRKELGLTQEKFGEKMGMSYAAVSLIELGKTTINEKHLKLLAGVFGINEDWLRTGNGGMYKEDRPPDSDIMLEMFRALSPEGRKMVLDYMEMMLRNEKKMRGETVTEGGEGAESAGIGPGKDGKTG